MLNELKFILNVIPFAHIFKPRNHLSNLTFSIQRYFFWEQFNNFTHKAFMIKALGN